MDLIAVADHVKGLTDAFATEAGGEGAGGLTINFFWILIAAANFIVFALIAYFFGFSRLKGNLDARRARIEEGLRDADAARQEREQATEQRRQTLVEARREANDIVGRAQRAADETREREVTATRSEIERLREQAAADIEAERRRALADVRGQVADLALAAAGRVVGETMTSERERRLVGEFLGQVESGPAAASGAAGQPG